MYADQMELGLLLWANSLFPIYDIIETKVYYS